MNAYVEINDRDNYIHIYVTSVFYIVQEEFFDRPSSNRITSCRQFSVQVILNNVHIIF